jgi:hypothetical protein
VKATQVDGHMIMSVAFTVTIRLTNGRCATLHPGVLYVIVQDPRGGFSAIAWAEESTEPVEQLAPYGVPL